MGKFARINIAFIPPQHVADHAIELCVEIAKNHEVEFKIGTSPPLPHLTVFSPEVPTDQMDEVIARIASLAQSTPPVSMSFTAMETLGGFVYATVSNSSPVKQVHNDVLELINPLRQNHQRDKYTTVSRDMFKTGLEYKNVLTYGGSLVGELYNPHLTITRLVDHSLETEVAAATKWSIPEFKINQIGIFASGGHGTCTKLLHSFNLA